MSSLEGIFFVETAQDEKQLAGPLGRELVFFGICDIIQRFWAKEAYL